MMSFVQQVVAAWVIALMIHPGLAFAEIRTDSPRQTVESLLELSDQLAAHLDSYRAERTVADYMAVLSVLDQMSELFDLTGVPPALRAQAGNEAAANTLDVLAVHPEFDPSFLPGVDQVEAGDETLFRVDDTRLRLQRVTEGARAGEVLFDAYTVAAVARWAKMQTASSDAARRWSEELDQLTGPLVPSWLVPAEPIFGSTKILGTPLWKVLIAAGMTGAALAGLVLLRKGLVSPRAAAPPDNVWVRLLVPGAALVASVTLTWLLVFELHVAGRLAAVVQSGNVLLLHFCGAWATWILVRAGFDHAAAGLDRRDDSIDINMLRLIGRITAALVAIVIFAIGAQALGLPVLSILAGFGIGGLAIALAIRPTFENLIGGFILYIDRPIRVGDYCAFGERSGTVEQIGVRSTQVRALDRTLITIPNAQFADMQLVNWAACDMMQIHTVLGLRYETDMETLRFVLAEIRKMLHAHPRIDNDTIRVRFAGFGAHSLDVELRVYAQTREWNDFFAIREDMLFRVGEIVEAAGTAFAFPSQTLYVARDGGLEDARTETSREKVRTWRRDRRLPFPRFAPRELRDVEGTLNYPPQGSPDFMAGDIALGDAAETLSTDPETLRPQKE